MTFRLYTVANDRMAAHLPRFLTLKKCFLPDVPLYVIPFDDEQNEVRRILANEENVFFVEPDERIDHIGKTIYGDEEYRPGIPAWRYFRKLNSLIGHNDALMFLDINTAILADPREFFELESMGGEQIVFGSKSAKYRTIKKQVYQDFLDALIPGAAQGFGAAFFISTGKFLDLALAKAMTSKNLRKVMGRSQEQAFIILYCAFFGKKPSLISEKGLAVIKENSPHSYRISHCNNYIVVGSGAFEKKIIALTLTGQELKKMPEVVEKFLDFKFP